MNPEEHNKLPRARIHLVWGCVFISFAVVGLTGYKISIDKADEAVSRAVDEAKNGVDRVIKEAKIATSAATAKAEQYAKELASFTERAAEKFKTGQITETFRAEIPVFKSAGIGLLEVGTSEATETFFKEDVRKVGWDWIYLGKTVSEISVPVTYRYHLDLGGDWEISVTDGNCIVDAPKLQPSLPVAIHTDGLRKKSSEGWARFDAAEQMEELQKSITPKLNTNAATPEHLNNVKEEARGTVARFIRAWLVREGQWVEGKITTVTVRFPDETVSSGPSAPTLTLKNLP
jgi:hypothetical protein